MGDRSDFRGFCRTGMESRRDFGEYLGSPKKRSIAVVQGSQRSPKVVFGERPVSAEAV